MPTREELFAAMQLIKGYCRSRDECQVIAQAATKDCCPFFTQFGARWCALQNEPPCAWPDTLYYAIPAEGDTDNGRL